MLNLTHFDRRHVAERLPRDIRDLLKTYAGALCVGGGFLRAVIGRETVNDIDLFGRDAAQMEQIAGALAALRSGSRIHKSKNAITLLAPDRTPVQFITRWTFDSVADLVNSFDFTVCQAVLWRSRNGEWNSRCGDRFYIDLAGRRLHYTSPVRDEEAGGSLLRVIKYAKRGYSIQVGSLGAVVARLACHKSVSAATNEADAALQLRELLREVDPLFVIDGMEVVDEHAPLDGESDLPE